MKTLWKLRACKHALSLLEKNILLNNIPSIGIWRLISITQVWFQKQPPDVFYIKICSHKFFKIHRKTPVPESFLIKLNIFFKKETLAQVFSCEFCEISKNTFFTKHLWWLLLKTVQYLRWLQIPSKEPLRLMLTVFYLISAPGAY